MFHREKYQHSTKWEGYTIKPIAYVFPQFHAIPENDKFWGVNFTEWNNVKKNSIMRIKQLNSHLISLHGIAYHHYWFGYPVMDQPLQAMLEDGQPDVPFMLSWANEPWTVRWDGIAIGDGTLLAQDYGNSTEWRRHFDWMATFFRHPNYIRSNGKVQFIVYASHLIGDTGKRMFAKWRRWAAEDPDIGGLDIIETLWLVNATDHEPADAINEFMPHFGGGFDNTAWERNDRKGNVYHRGVMVSWDNAPRHANDNKSVSTIWDHPEVWKQSLIGVMRRIKLDPNPQGQENFLFLNALNEWGEGNVLEPSIQWGSEFSKAFRAAKDYADRSLPWVDDLIRQGEELEPEVMDETSQVDVCVIIRDSWGMKPWSEVWQLQHTLWSLQAQHNPRWRAVVVPVGQKTLMKGIEAQVLDTFDPRIRSFNIPDELRSDNATNSADDVTDWVIENISEMSPSCGKATYVLITNASTTYEPHTFDVASRKRTGIIGLNFVSPSTKALQDQRETNLAWNQRCARYSEKTPLQLCQRMLPEHEALDISAALVNLGRWRKEQHKLKEAKEKYGNSVSILAELEKRDVEPWAWAPPASSQCDVIQTDTYPSCIRTGHLWFDGPDVGGFNSGCYSSQKLQEAFGGTDLPTHWDYKRFKHEDPVCVRLSEERYHGVLAGEVVTPAKSDELKKVGEGSGN
ncbi:hypothetical protein N0V82_004061 [Gnomoniopsis sp. IMI 355080]|nr:hypothetical protein N0V82_004061 [Gnomoniopsis sp. IMI 355080]